MTTPPPSRSDSEVIDLVIRLVFIGLFIFAALDLMAPLMGFLLWAVILAVAVYPAHAWLAGRLGGRERLSAGLLTGLGLVITLGPVALLGAGVIDAATGLVSALQDGSLNIPDAEELRGLPIVGDRLADAWNMIGNNMEETLQRLGPPLLSAGGAVLHGIAGIGGALVMLALSVLIMGLMLVPGPRLAAEARRFANRVFAPRGGAMIDMAGATVRNVSRGVIGIAAAQALLAGLLMVAFGVPLAGPLAGLALFLSIIQVGPGLVLIPVTIWVWMNLGTGLSVLFTVLVVPVMIFDNFARPIVMSAGLATPMLVILVGVIGGMLAYGLVGLFIGPVVLAVFWEMLSGWLEAQDEAAEG